MLISTGITSMSTALRIAARWQHQKVKARPPTDNSAVAVDSNNLTQDAEPARARIPPILRTY